jgi:hypothetical protein
METERRSERRFELSRMVVYDMGKERYIDTRASDVSRGGVSFISDEYLEPDVAVWVTFSIPLTDGTSRELESEGQVTSVADMSGGCRFGVSFTRMTQEDRAILEEFIQRQELVPGMPDPGFPTDRSR